ncbi:aminoacyl-tRNA deacylase [Streptococcus sp. sy010]|uniref:aminoacyl-tRNA deacylase n=1 Tax=Streptococcus sp. sy010 TaxID=2600148 RepID=UPI0011B7CB05|nr:aminoacyl-tRNA deacylase [Streptococcus sp. sy010]TWT14715.1 aminoacyl-tRNA deacylase [Streptococcus sp. sy010]
MSKKHKLKKTLVEQILDKQKISYQSLALNALTEQVPTEIQKERIFKTLALTGDKTGTLIALVPLTTQVSEKKLAKLSQNKKVQMIPQKDLEKTTGYIHGANNPIGIRQRHPFPIFIDQTALNLGQIIVSAGELGRSIQIDSQDLADFVQAAFADLIHDIN